MLNHEPECQSIFLVKFHPKYFENGPGGRVKNRTSLTETQIACEQALCLGKGEKIAWRGRISFPLLGFYDHRD